VFITYSLLQSRHLLDRIAKSGEKKSTDILLSKYPDTYNQDLEEGTELWLVGMNLRRIFPDYFHMIERKLGKGGSLKALLLNPNTTVTKYAANQDHPTTEEDYINTIRRSLFFLDKLKKLAPERVEIRLLDYPMSFGVDAVDINGYNGIIHVRFYPHQSPHGDIPRMVFTPQDKFWYAFFKEQVESLWNQGTIWNRFEDSAQRAPDVQQAAPN